MLCLLLGNHNSTGCFQALVSDWKRQVEERCLVLREDSLQSELDDLLPHDFYDLPRSSCSLLQQQPTQKIQCNVVGSENLKFKSLLCHGSLLWTNHTVYPTS